MSDNEYLFEDIDFEFPDDKKRSFSDIYFNDINEKGNQNEPQYPVQKKINYRTNRILVNPCQKGNPVLLNIRNIAWEYSNIVPDFQVGETSCVLYLSLKYHRLHPEYIFRRIEELGNRYLLRILLIFVDVTHNQSFIRELTKLTMDNNITVVVSWSVEESGRYLETFKSYENKPPDLIKEKVDNDYYSKLTDFLTQVKSVNKTDVLTLISNYGTVKRIVEASPTSLVSCSGFGDQKANRLANAFREPFIVKEKKSNS